MELIYVYVAILGGAAGLVAMFLMSVVMAMRPKK